ncbi:uncharacterized protein LOC117295642 [Asterias rubens]|uniref:uncharacterized protein LOC117295642 n=1 Tax=Asterias rubens TaxID=7604 RepID=UPI00145510DE|nr:uncharacterized protein LOC117295642 [Asterias rubens]
MVSLLHRGSIVALLIVLFSGELTCISILRGPIDRIVIEGETVVFTCQIRNKGNFRVFWYFDRDARYLSADTVFFEDARSPRLSIVGNQRNGFFNLRISPVRRTDAGIYRCGFVPVGSTQLMDVRARLTVHVPPLDGFPRCEIDPPVGLALRQRATLTCTSEGGIPPASLTWLQNGTPITPAVLHRNVIERLFDEALNGVEFTCQAKSPAFMGVRTCSFVPLRIDPTARIEPPQLIATPGQDVTFTCIAGGVSPIVEYMWVFGNIIVPSLEDGDRFVLTMDHVSLTIRNVQLVDDMTSVRCTVVTPNGLTATAGALLRVLLAEDIPTTILAATTTLAEVTTVIPTTLTANPNQTFPLPTPEYGGGLGGGTIIGIIIGAIVAAQIVIACFVFTAHKIISKYERHRDMAMVPSLASWTGQQTHVQPYQGLDQTGRSASTLRYLSLHPLRAPPSRYSCVDVGVYEAAVDSNTNTIVYDSGYIPNNNTTQQANQDSMDDMNNEYQPVPTAPQMETAFYEQPNESAAIDRSSSREEPYYEPAAEETSTGTKQGTAASQKDLYYEPPVEETPIGDGGKQGTGASQPDLYYEQPPVEDTPTGTKQGTPATQQDLYYEPPVETSTDTKQGTPATQQELYYEPPLEDTPAVTKQGTSATQQDLYYEPPPIELNDHTLSDEETDNYELPPVVNDQQTAETEPEYYEPPVELQTTVTDSLAGEHEYDVTPNDDNEYEIPGNTDIYVEQD